MTYNRYALERVGGLEIIYNRRGQIVDIVDLCKRWQRGYAYNQNITKTIATNMAIIKTQR
jgi:hypothetical protein